VADADVTSADLVVDLGAGKGAITAALARRGARVLAVEIDAALGVGLARRFGATRAVTTFTCDATEFPLPSTPYRVVANPPFNRTAAILHRLLDDPAGALARADLVLQWQVVRALARSDDRTPPDLVAATWAPWWSFGRGRRLPASLFRPAPSVDAAVLIVTRRAPALLAADEAPRYRAFVRDQFAATSPPVSVPGWISRYRAQARVRRDRDGTRGAR
jgi:23S rRNA (adenine-N6)-dimethyltransferase